MAEKVPDLCAVAAGVLGLSGEYPANAAQVVNNAKVSDHHALLPTAEAGRADLATLPTGERNILHMIAVRLLCAVGEAHTYTESAAILECGGASFTAKGRTTLAQGWKVVESAYLTTLKRRPKQEEQAPPVCSCTVKCAAGAVNTACEVCAVNMSECAGPEPEPQEPDKPPEAPATPETPEKKGGNPLIIVALLAVLGAGGAVAYLKFFKKKADTKGSADLDDYDYGTEDEEDEPEDDEDMEDE